jgi:8-oxo-dGTP diphosphatase
MISRAIILKNNKILLIHRIKNSRVYFIPPGGHIEPNESEKECVIREIKEETNLDAQIDKKLWSIKSPLDNSLQHFFLVTKFKGNLELGGPEKQKNSKQDQYILEWHDIDNLSDLNLVPSPLKEKLLPFLQKKVYKNKETKK